MKKLVLFDIDGVIYEGHFIFDSIQDQEKMGIIKTGLWNKVLDLLSKYKNGELNYKQAADLMLENYALSLKGKNYSELVDYSLSLIKNNLSKFFPYFDKLTSNLQKTYDIYLVSTNFDFATEAVTKHFSLNGYLSSKVEMINGILTGNVALSLGGNKSIVAELIKKYGKLGSIAVGDSENDADMLDLVEFPFVMKPNEKLAEIAKIKSWQVVNRDTITDIILKHAK